MSEILVCPFCGTPLLSVSCHLSTQWFDGEEFKAQCRVMPRGQTSSFEVDVTMPEEILSKIRGAS